MKHTRKLTLTALIVALTTVSSHIIFIPVGFAKIFPIQHLANVVSAVLLGPSYAVMQALFVSTLRNLLGTGSLLAFPGSLFGAILSGLLFLRFKKIGWAYAGEVIGTGLLGALASYPIASLFMGQEAALFGFMPAFLLSSAVGAFIAYFLLKELLKVTWFKKMVNKNMD